MTDGIANAILPSLPPKFRPYANDPVGFIQDIFGARLTEDQKRICLSVRDHKITLVETANALGKDWVAARIGIWWTRCHLGAQTYLSQAPPEENLKNILWGEVDSALATSDQELSVGMTRHVMSIEYGPKYWMKGVTIPSTGSSSERQARFSGKHAPYLLFILDEADAIPMEVFNGAESCMSGGVARILILLNPRNPSGWTYELRKHPDVNLIQLSAFNHPNVTTGKDIIPGAVTREVTINRIYNWTRPLAEGEKADPTRTFTIPDFLDGAYTLAPDGSSRTPLVGGRIRVVINPQFDHMVLGRYSGLAGQQLISQEWVKRAQTNWRKWVEEHGDTPPKGVKPIIGVDVGEYDQDQNQVCQRYDKYIPPLIGWTGLDLEATGDRISDLAQSLEGNYENIFVDAIGVGAGVPGQLRRKGVLKVVGVKVSEKPTTVPKDDNGIPIGHFAALRDQILWMLREWLRLNPDAMLPEDQELESELITLTYAEDRKGRLKIIDKVHLRKILGRSPNKAEAIALSFSPPKVFHIGLV